MHIHISVLIILMFLLCSLTTLIIMHLLIKHALVKHALIIFRYISSRDSVSVSKWIGRNC